MAKVSPEVGVVRYELACLLVKSGCEDVQLEYGFDGFIITHFTTNTSSTMQPRRIPATFSPCLLLHGYHGFCFGFRHAEIDAEIHQFVSNEYGRLCWPHFYLGPRDSDGERERDTCVGCRVLLSPKTVLFAKAHVRCILSEVRHMVDLSLCLATLTLAQYIVWELCGELGCDVLATFCLGQSALKSMRFVLPTTLPTASFPASFPSWLLLKTHFWSLWDF